MDIGTDQVTCLPVEMQLCIFVMILGLPDDIHEETPTFIDFVNTWLPSDGRTDRSSYRDARTHLKTVINAWGFPRESSQLFPQSQPPIPDFLPIRRSTPLINPIPTTSSPPPTRKPTSAHRWRSAIPATGRPHCRRRRRCRRTSHSQCMKRTTSRPTEWFHSPLATILRLDNNNNTRRRRKTTTLEEEEQQQH